MLFQVPSVISSFKMLKDGSLKMNVDVQELPPSQATTLLSLTQKSGWFLFKENTFNEEEIPDEPAPEFNDDKTQSKRLRDCLYVLWKKTKVEGDFESYYRKQMETFITVVKNKIPEEI